jgi:ATP-dependent helicase HrpB
MVAIDAMERRSEKDARPGSNIQVRLASAIEPEWLAALFPGEIQQSLEFVWNEAAGRVDEVRKTSYDQLSLEETVQPARPSEAVARLLADAAFARNLSCFPDCDEVAALQVRLDLLCRCYPGAAIQALDGVAVRAAVEKICSTKRNMVELRRSSLGEELAGQLSARQRDLLRREAPERIQVGPKRAVKIHYENGKSPWIESRLQDFFRMKSTPAVCGGRIPLTIHLLAPNGRAVQVTQDLAGFWKRHYPVVRRELQRRYPRHAWPDPKDL